MNYKQQLNKVFILLICLTILSSCAQNSSKIAGAYELGGALLIVNTDNTCFLAAENALVKGVVTINKSTVNITPYVPKVPFILYGRKSSSRIGGNTIMFQSFSEEETLINYEENNNAITKMKRVFNENANCIEYPNVWDNPNEIGRAHV